ncbi:hypothetical protein ABIA39_001592 [Nocardia sp. GAS34]|uniref:helix-turn-helix domain-containing protein n=1 Tax=unclassified Nocardia TaxID=2637762 RepID=UPI003D1CF7F5
MKGLLLRLSGLDADAESAVRVIEFFDALITGRADLDTLLRNTAALAECQVGVEAAGRGLVLRADPSGTVDVHAAPPRARIRTVGDASFWLARPAGTMAFDEMVLERLALSGSILLDSTVNPLPAMGDSALVELAVSDSAGIAERSRALHLLGVGPTAPLRVAVSARPPSGPARWAQVGDQAVTLLPADAPPIPPDAEPTGIGPALPAIRASESWRDARTALRLSCPEQPVVRADELGGLLVLAGRLRPQDIATSPDVAALDRIAAEPGGADLIAILRAVCTTDSIRKAATVVHRHHSTVAYRLEQAESVLGFALDNPHNRFRLHLAMVMRMLG